MRSRASMENEQNIIHLQTEHGEMVFKQIAGAIARRVVCWKAPGDSVKLGERIGLIRFGSRMDVWLPQGADVVARVGQHVSGGVRDRKSTRLNSSHRCISYAVFCLKKKKITI